MKPFRILLVDQNGTDLEYVTRSLMNLGAGSPVIARNESEALDDIDKRNPELVILNLNESESMKSMSLASKIRVNHSKPILFLTPDTESEAFEKLNLGGSNHYLIKPFEGNDLKSAIELAVSNLEYKENYISHEKQFLNAIKSMSDGLISTDIVGNVTYMNPVAEALTGWTLAEARRMVLQDVFPITNSSGKESHVEIASGIQINTSLEKFFLDDKFGRKIPIQNSASPLKDQKGSLVGLVVVFRQPNDLRYGDNKNDCEAESIKKIVDGLAEPLFLVDEFWILKFTNIPTLDFFKSKNDRLIGENLWNLTPSSISNGDVDKAKSAMTNRNEFKFDFFDDQVGGWYELSGYPYGDGMMMRISDVTTRIQESQTALRMERLESLSLMARGFAHDFNNLLTVILGNLSLANVKLPKSAEGFDEVENALSGTIRAQNRIQQLLTFAKGGAPIKKHIDLSEIVHEISNEIDKIKNINYSFDLPKSIWIVDADPGQFRRVVENLLRNAEQAMPEGGDISITLSNLDLESDLSKSIKRTLELNASCHYVLMKVSDNGKGVNESEKLKIFEPYYTTKSDANATGIGLTVCQSIIQAHEGSIIVESTAGKGTSVYVALPALINTGESDFKDISNEINEKAIEILILEDDSLIRQLLVANLEKEGYTVSQTEEGGEAVNVYIEKFESGKSFDLVIMDLSIPNGMGGADAIKKIREVDPNVVAIVSSGYSDDPVMSDPKSYGFDAVLPKPYKPHELNLLVKKTLK
ncbi:MAG: hypothetical protein CMO54_05060 [Verrucomicrobiales bacterium]|nr:hypothetical protein [Verrucomicrobiales bacterium]